MASNDKDITESVRYCAQGDVKQALLFLAQQKRLSPSAQRFYKKLRRRFENSAPSRVDTHNPMVKKLIQIYREYYRKMLMRELSYQGGEKYLLAQLRAFVTEFKLWAGGVKDLSYFQKSIKKVLERHGFKSALGTIKPFQSAMIWVKEEKKTFHVTLAESKQRVTVRFLTDILERSWITFATLGIQNVGGWAEQDALYCFKKGYKLDSDRFKASYLAHEGQHFADYKQFPKLEQIDLEYRAKLAEIIASRRPNYLFNRFRNQAKKDRRHPHMFASYCLVRDLNRNANQRKANAVKLRELAKRTLITHSKNLTRAGRKTVMGVL